MSRKENAFFITAKDVLLRSLGRMTPSGLMSLMFRRMLSAKSERLPPEQALRLVLDLHSFLEVLAGKLSVRAGNGIHSKHRHMRYHEFFIAHIPYGSGVIDIGCGNGYLANKVAQACNSRILAIDLDKDKIALAERLHSHPLVTYACADAYSLQDCGDFETVILSNVLEHLTGRPEFLTGLVGHYHPRQMLIRVPSRERDWMVPLKMELGLEWRCDPTHETEYTIESLTSELSSAGLTIEQMECRWGEIWVSAVPSSTGTKRMIDTFQEAL